MMGGYSRLLDSLCETCVFYCVPRAPGKPRGAQGIRARRPCDQAFRDWLSADVTSVSLPLPSSSSTLSLSQSFSASLCAALLPFSPLSFSFAFPQHPPCWRWCVSGVFRQAGPKRRGQPIPPSPPPIVCLFLGVHSVSPALPLQPLPLGSPPTQHPCAGVWELGPLGWGVEGMKNMLCRGAA